MTATTIAVIYTTTTSSTSFTAKQGICVYKELNRRINTIKQTTEKKRICKLNIFTCWNRRV